MKAKLFLIDGHALIFKMYYAFLRRPMINSKGEDTSILFGFMKYLLEMIHREEPTHLAVAFDPPGGTFRNEMYPEYKANRDETPQLVIDALEPLEELCKALDIPVLMMPGFEADDVIGSMARQMKSPGTDIYMVTPDKDYGQLVDEGIFQYRPGKSGENAEIYDEKAICAKYGISSPRQVIEMLTICGDTADNVPGVKGVGEVGAAKLIARYGSVENIYNHLDELTPRQREQFLAAKGHIGLSHDLVTIKTDIPLDVAMEDMRLTLKYDNKVAELFEHYEFNSLKRLVPESANVKVTVPDNARRLNINEITPDKMALETRTNGMMAISIEKTDLQGPVATVATCPESECRKGGNEDLSLNVSTGPANLFKDILEDNSIAKYGKDLKAQSGLLADDGITLCGKQFDIALMHYLINPEKSHNIDILAKAYLGIDITAEEEVVAEPTSLFDIPEETPDNKADIRRTAAILPTGILIGDELRATAAGTHTLSELYDNMEEPLMLVLAKMESCGVKVDLGQLKEFADGLRKEMKEREVRIREMTGEPELNISSPKQVGDVLFDKLKLDPKAKKTSRGSYPTDEATLTALGDKHPVIGEILEFRAVKKLLSTYIEPFPGYISRKDGRVHTTFNQALTATGRLSSSNPNLQNIPIRTERGKEIRKAFVPKDNDGFILSADYSQIELRIMAHLSGDEHLTGAFRSGVDVHRATAAKIFGIPYDEVSGDQRRIAKTANFGIMYGISSFGLAQRLGISRSEAKKIIDDYFEAFPSVKTYIERTVTASRENGYVETLFGRRRYIPDINAKNAVARSLAERNAVNAPIQGTSADIIKLAMINVDRKMEEAGLRSRMVLQIHDELLFDACADEVERLSAIVKEEMEHVTELSVPLTVECNYGKNWLEAH
ncbi:MAG: DNA polymerase I [Candidatus Cryptobacteroides sp.]